MLSLWTFFVIKNNDILQSSYHVEKYIIFEKDCLKSMDCCCPNTLGKPLNILSSLDSPSILSSLGNQPLGDP
jgi:hypothetical protein